MSRKTAVCSCSCELRPRYPGVCVLLLQMLLGMASTAVGIQLLWHLCFPAVICSLEIFPFVFLVAYNLHSCVILSLLVLGSLLEMVSRYFQINLSLLTPCTLPITITVWSLGLLVAVSLPTLQRQRKTFPL